MAPDLPLLAAAYAAPSSTPPPAGNPSTTMTAPADGSTVPAGSAVPLAAALSPDLVSALQAGSGGTCYFEIGDDADSAKGGTLDLAARTCTATWTFGYADSYSLTAWVSTPAGITYSSAPVTVTVTGGSDPRCSGAPNAPTSCVYRWAEVYYTWSTGTRHTRVCAIDGGCQWQTAHISWTRLPSSDYWVNSTGDKLPDGNAAEAYLCIGSAPADWTDYGGTGDFDALLARPETSAAPVPASTC